jgi:hypothetical protein
VRLDADILLEIWDTDTGVDASTVVIKVDGLTAWTGDLQQSGFVVTKTVFTGGIRYLINPDVDFKPTVAIEVEVAADDLETSPNSMLEQRTFCTGAWF